MNSGKRLANPVIFVVVLAVGGGAMSAVMNCDAQSPNACSSNQVRLAVFVLAPMIGLLIIFAAHKFLGQGEE